MGTGLSDEQRGLGCSDIKQFFDKTYKNKIIEIQYNQVLQSKDGLLSLFLPVFIEVRTDKNEANTASDLYQ